MERDDRLAQRFEENRPHLRAVAYRMLGSTGEADDAVQEAWLRLSRADAGAIDNLGGWLTTVVARVSLDMMRKRTSLRERSVFSEIRATTVVSQPPRFSMASASLRLSRSQVSCTASSASLTEPSIR